MKDFVEINEPIVCPYCGALVVHKITLTGELSAVAYCSNENCLERRVAALTYFVSKHGMDIDGLSESIIRKFVESGIITDWYSIFELSEYKIIDSGIWKNGEKGKLAGKLIKSILKSIDNGTEQALLSAFGIESIGRVNAGKILSVAGSIEGLIEESEQTMVDIVAAIGPAAATDFYEWRVDHIEELRKASEVAKLFPKKENVEKGTALSGAVTMATGTLKNFSRDGIKDYVISNGGTYASGVNKKLTYMIVGEAPGESKVARARELGIEMITEEEFLSRINNEVRD